MQNRELELSLTPIHSQDYESWALGLRERLATQRVLARSMTPRQAAEFAQGLLGKLLPDGASTPDHHLLAAVADDIAVGHVWVRVRSGGEGVEAFVFDAALTAAGQELRAGTALMDAVEAMARSRGAEVLRINVFRQDSATVDLVQDRGFEVASTQMVLELERSAAVVAEAELRPMTAQQFTEFVARQEATYAADLIRSGTAASAAEAAARASEEMADQLPDGLESQDQHLWAAYHAEEEVGALWLEDEEDSDHGQVFVYYVEVHPAYRRRGHGREIMRAAEQWCRSRGARSIRLSVFGFNDPARALYDQLGYRVTEELLKKSL